MTAVSITKEDAMFATGCRKLAEALAARSPFESVEALVATAQKIWWGGDDIGVAVDADGIRKSGEGSRPSPLENVVVGVPEWLEAIAMHPHIGSDRDLERGYARERAERNAPSSSSVPPLSPTRASAEEQAGAGLSSFETRADLARWNDLYERKFGHMFMLCAFGKSGEEILGELKRRYFNPPYAELAIAANEKIKIVERRLRWLCSGSRSEAPRPAATEEAATTATEDATGPPRRPPITTHVLDTSLGKPARGVGVKLLSRPPGAPAESRAWVPAEGANHGAFSEEEGVVTDRPRTDGDGRCSTLLVPGAPRPPPGCYRIEFDVGGYFDEARKGAEGYGGGGVLVRSGGSDDGDGSGAFYPSAAVEFVVSPTDKRNNNIVSRPDHLHIPLTFSPFGYSTYRGS